MKKVQRFSHVKILDLKKIFIRLRKFILINIVVPSILSSFEVITLRNFFGEEY